MHACEGVLVHMELVIHVLFGVHDMFLCITAHAWCDMCVCVPVCTGEGLEPVLTLAGLD